MSYRSVRSLRRLPRPITPLQGAFVALAVLAATLMPFVDSAQAATLTQTFNYQSTAQTFTVPEGVSSLTLTMVGGKGGRGGYDSQGAPAAGGYRGVVTGSIDVTPGQVLTLGVGGGGASGVTGGGVPGGAGGLNPLDGYDGSIGGTSGPLGGSGSGGGGGAATVVRIDGGDSADDVDIVAAGAGGGGGSGQFFPIVGRQAESQHSPRPDATSTNGRPGLTTSVVCSAGFRCDGGASGAGGGGVQGGDHGDVQYGGATATEYFGFGGFPGSNGTGGILTLSESYEYFADNNGHGSITISYDSGTPGAPTRLSGTPRPGAVDLTWSAPASPGASDITDYIVSWSTSPNGTYTVVSDGVSTNTSVTVPGLTNGTTYYFRVAAVNSYGTGANTAVMSVGVMPSDVPNAPTLDAVTAADSSLLLDLTPGATHSPVIGYQYRLDGGEWFAAQAEAGRITVGGLTNGRSYAVQIRALNAVGASQPSGSLTGTPRAVPSTPSNLIATPSDSSVALRWDAPAATNGSPVQDYVIQRATAETGPWTAVTDGTSVLTTATVTGLTNGTTYYFRVAAVNAAGTGAPTTPGIAVPFTVPDAPSATVEPADGSLRVQVTQPSDGGSAILRYEYQLGTSTEWVSTGSAATTFTIGGLANGTATTVRVRAVNAAGASTASADRTATPRSVPGAPAISTVALDTGAIAVDFSVGSDGGSPITNYEYSVDGGSTWITRSPASATSPVSISGLVGGQTYQVALRAVNVAGPGAASNLSTVVAKGTPEAPRSVSVVASDRTLTVDFDTPSNGGSPITNYDYSLDGGSTWQQRVPASVTAPIVIGGLANGTAVQVRVRAVNAVGAGDASASTTATPRTTPSAPTIVDETIVGVDGTLEVVFSAPSSDGGSSITSYEYSTDAGRTWRRRDAGTTGSPLVITTQSDDGTSPLEGGEVYPVELRAVNAAGAGAASAVADGITTTVPDAPSIVDTVVLDGAASIELDLPANGGSEITAYEYRLDGGTWTDTGSLSDSFVISGLANAQTYTVEVRAVNGRGPSAPSAPSQLSIRTTPGAPEVGDVVADDGALHVEFTPGDDGGDPVTGYEYSTDGGATWRARATGTTGSPLTITTSSSTGEPLVNGELVTVQLRARNGAGAGAASRSTLIAPLGAPDAPGDVQIIPGDRQLTVSYELGSDGGSALTATEYRLDGGAWTDTGSQSSPFTITGLVNGVEHVVEVRVVNPLGASDASAPATATPRTVPGQPSSVTATGGDGSASLSWSAPADDGGGDVRSHTATFYDRPTGGIAIASCTASALDATPTSCEATALTNGRTLYVSVTATNDAGTGAASSPRVAVTPLAVPTVTVSQVSVGANSIVVDLDVDDGGSPISDFEYSLDGGAWTSAATSTEPLTISGLVTGRTYGLRVRAGNAVGTGDASPSVDVTPRTTPGAPTGVIAQSGDRSVALSWQSPEDDGGEAVTDHVVQFATSASGPFTTFDDGVSSANSATVTGLTNGTEYYFRVSAANGAGAGLNSPVVAATPLAAPGAPTITSLTPGNRFVQMAFTANASNGGSAVTRYEYALDGVTWRALPTMTSPQVISGLDNGRTYSVTLRAVNAVGGGTPSAAVTVTPYGLPGGVQGFLASPGANDVTLSWDAANANGSPITSYNLIRWSARTEGSILASYQTTGTSYTVPSLSTGTHYFTIEATNAAGTGQRSNPRTTAMVGSTVPAAPTVSAATIRPDVAGHSVALAWTHGAAGTSAITGTVIRRVPATGPAVTLSMIDGTATSADLALADLVDGDHLQIAAISAVGVGPFTTVRLPIVTGASVDEVTTRTASAAAAVEANSTDVDVTLELAPYGLLGTSDAVEIATDPATIDAGETSPVDVVAELTDLDPGTRYQARVVARSGAVTSFGAPAEFITEVGVTTSGLTKVYDGEPLELTSVTEPSGVALTRTFEGIDGTVHPLGTDAPIAAGTYRVVTRVAEGSGNGVETTVATISPLELGIEVQAAGKVYDGSSDATVTATISGAVEGDDVAVDPSSLSASFADANAGVDREVTITVDGDVLVGADAANYSVTVPDTAVATIERRIQTIEFVEEVPSSLEVGAVWSPEATSTAGLDVDLLIAAGDGVTCELVDGELRMIAVGDCILVASQAGTPNVTPAIPLARVIEVREVPPTTTVPPTTVPPTTAPPTTEPPSTTVPPTTTVPPSTTVPPAPTTTAPAPPTTAPQIVAPPAEPPAPAPATPSTPSRNRPSDRVGGLGRNPGDGGSSATGSGSSRSADAAAAAAATAAAEQAAAAQAAATAEAEAAARRDAEAAAAGSSDGRDREGERGNGSEVAGLGEEIAGSADAGVPGSNDISWYRWWWVPTALLIAACVWFVLRSRRTAEE